MPNFKNKEGDPDFGERDSAKVRPNSYGKDIETVAAQEDRELIKRRHEAMAPAPYSHPLCPVCKHPNRNWIEMLLAGGKATYASLERDLPGVSRHSLSNHARKHLKLEDAAMRAVIEEEARLAGENIEEGTKDLVTKRSVLEVALRRGFDDIVNGVTTVEPRDLIQIAKLLAEMDSQASSAAVDEARAQVSIFMEAIRDVCDSDVRHQIGERVKTIRKRDSITAALEAPMIEKAEEEVEVVEAEVIEQ